MCAVYITFTEKKFCQQDEFCRQSFIELSWKFNKFCANFKYSQVFPRICLNQHFGALIFNKPVYVMLSAVFGSWDFENISNAKKGFLSVSICYHLKDCEIFQDTVHHILFWEVLELENKVDHVFAHGASVNFIKVPPSLVSCIFRFHFFHHLFPETAHLGRALYRHVLRAFIRCCHAIKSVTLIWSVRVEVCPKFYQKESVLGSLFVQLL